MRELTDRDRVAIRLPSHPRHLAVVRAVVRAFGRGAGLPEARLHALALATDEGCTNVIRHAHAGRTDGEITVDCRLERGSDGRQAVVVRLHDDGPPVDPDRLQPPAPLDPTTPGGLGLHLMRAACDRMTVRCDPTLGNVLELAITCPEAISLEPAARPPNDGPR